jgi:hypothetical protein
MCKIVAAAVLLLVSSMGAMAAPFCLLITGAAPMCIYVDGAECARQADRQNGACEPNESEVRLPTSRIGEYCLVLPGGYSHCGYEDGIVCAREALTQKGICTKKSAGASPQQLPNAYDPNAGR